MNCCSTFALWAIAKRQLGSFLRNPLGYIFIFAFVVAFAAINFLPDGFYSRNIADFGASVTGGISAYQLMPYLLAIFIPGIAMTAWASEREFGTEELLLTMPVSIADAVLGKYLAIVLFFTLALLCNLTNVWCLAIIGDPDAGQILANFLGWWLTGISFIALALLGSVLVGSSAISWVVGTLLCGAGALLVDHFTILDGFNRGLFDFAALLFFVALIVIGLSGSLLYLASRRWGPDSGGRVAAQVTAVLLSVILAINLGRIADRQYWNVDLSIDRVSSLSENSAEILQALPYPAQVTLFISDDSVLPEHIRGKVREVLDKVQALERAAPAKIEVQVLRPRSIYDDLGRMATEEYGIQPRQMLDRTVMGAEQVQVFLGAAITCADTMQRIAFFEPGLSVEYELVRNLRTAANKAIVKPPVEVRIVHAASVADWLPEQWQKLQQWREKQDGKDAISIQLLSVADSVEEQEGLRAQDVAIATAAANEAETEKSEDASAGDVPPPPEYKNVLFGAVIDGPQGSVRVPTLAEADVATAMAEAIRRARRPVPVIGVLQTDLEIVGGFNPQTFQPKPAWSLINEWRTHYEVRPVQPAMLDPETSDDIDVLLAPLPSSLTPEDLERLHHYIWAGRPTIVCADPFPFFGWAETGGSIAPAAPRQQQRPMMGQAPPPPEPKAGVMGMAPFLEALGVDYNLQQLVWSDYNPSIMMQNVPKEFLWVSRDAGGIADHQITEGLELVMMLLSGTFTPAADSGLKVEPLLRLSQRSNWGIGDYEEYVDRRNPMQASPRFPDGKRRVSPLQADRLLAAHISGAMPHAYGFGAIEPGSKSRVPINVTLIADTDLLHSQFYQIYKDFSTGRDSELPDPTLTKLRNVQFVENIVDYMLKDTDMIALRAAWPSRRVLSSVDEFRVEGMKGKSAAQLAKQKEAEEQIAAAKRSMEERLEAIRSQPGLDERSRQEKIAFERSRQQRKVDLQIAKINRELEQEIGKLEVEQRENIEGYLRRVKWFAIGLPALLIGALVLLVSLIRLARERAAVPATRHRSS